MTYHRPTYMGSDDPAWSHMAYYPWWLDNLADDATGEGAFMQGAAQGAQEVRALVTYARTVYEYQDFNHFGEYGEDGFIEDYTTRIHGEPTGVIVTVARNAAGEAQHIVVNHRRAALSYSWPACSRSALPTHPWKTSSPTRRVVRGSVRARHT